MRLHNLQLYCLDVQAFAELISVHAVDHSGHASAMKLQIMQGKPLLVSTDGKGCNDYWVTVPMRGPEISLPRLSVTGNPDSSIINEYSAIHQSICHE